MGEILFSFLNNLIFVVLLNIFGFWLIFWVYFSNRKEKINQLFLLMMTPIILWTDFNYVGNTTNIFHISIIFKRLDLATVCVFFIFVYFFSLHFPHPSRKRYPLLDKIIIFSWGLTSVLTIFTDLIIKDVEIKKGFPDFILGVGSYIFYSLVAFFTFFILFILFQKYFTLSKENKLKVQYFLSGASIFASFNLIFNVVFPLFLGMDGYYQLGDYSAFFLLGFTAYAIVKQELFGIKVVLTALLVGSIAILLLFDVLISPGNLVLQLFKGLILIVFLYFGYLLIKSVLEEIERRKELENLSSRLATTNIKLEAAYKKLEKLDKAKSEFLSIASHQLRTPLSAIKGYVSMMREKSYGEPTKKMEDPLENIYSSNERLIKLVNDLLDVSRIDAGKIEVNLEKTDLEELINSLIDEFKIEAQNKKIYLKLEKSKEELPKILLDGEKIRQAILNILDNAIRYTEKGGITIKLKKEDSKVQIIISDTGSGLTKEELAKMFESFSRGSAGTRLYTEGAGLGLYIAKKFVEMHSGKIWAESPGKGLGSSFYIELPLVNK